MWKTGAIPGQITKPQTFLLCVFRPSVCRESPRNQNNALVQPDEMLLLQKENVHTAQCVLYLKKSTVCMGSQEGGYNTETQFEEQKLNNSVITFWPFAINQNVLTVAVSVPLRQQIGLWTKRLWGPCVRKVRGGARNACSNIWFYKHFNYECSVRLAGEIPSVTQISKAWNYSHFPAFRWVKFQAATWFHMSEITAALWLSLV